VHWRSGPDRFTARRAPPRGTPILLGAALPLVVGGLAAAVLSTSRRAPPAQVLRTPIAKTLSPTVIERPQTATIGFIRAVAGGQLKAAGRQLDACRHDRSAHLSHRALPGWRDCVKWPVAHLAVGARTNAAMLGALSNELPIGDCRRLALGTSNTSRILSAEADELVKGLFNTTPSGRGLSDQHYVSLIGLITTVRDMVRGPAWGACRPTSQRTQIQ
jgi:hypothetical protein